MKIYWKDEKLLNSFLYFIKRMQIVIERKKSKAIATIYDEYNLLSALYHVVYPSLSHNYYISKEKIEEIKKEFEETKNELTLKIIKLHEHDRYVPTKYYASVYIPKYEHNTFVYSSTNLYYKAHISTSHTSKKLINILKEIGFLIEEDEGNKIRKIIYKEIKKLPSSYQHMNTLLAYNISYNLNNNIKEIIKLICDSSVVDRNRIKNIVELSVNIMNNSFIIPTF